MKITELQLQQLKDLNDSKVNEILGLGLQVGKWYRHNCGNSLVFRNNDSGNYGFFIDKWGEDFLCSVPSQWTPATHKEVQYALIEEAKRRYKTNDIVKCKHHNCDTVIHEMLSFVFHEKKLWSKSDFGNVCIFKDGKWAEVISNPIQEKIDKLEQELNELKKLL